MSKGYSSQEVVQALVNTARNVPNVPTREEGAGAWNLRAALAKLAPPEPPTRLEWLRAAGRRIVTRIQNRSKANRADRWRLWRVNEEIERIG